MPQHYANPGFLISAEDLARRLGDPELVVLDATTTLVPDGEGGFRRITGEAAFEEGHIPSARYVDLERDFSRPAPGLLFTLPDVAQFAEAAGWLGIGANSTVVVYSTGQPGWAARFWLMLRAFGFTNAAVLNGGFAGWKGDGHPVERGPAKASVQPAKPFDWADRTGDFFVGTDQVEQASAEIGTKLVNALPTDIFRGTGEIFYGRPGHIPGSTNLPTGSLVDGDGRYLTTEAMNALFTQAGIQDADDVIAYCGAGVAASNVAFARQLLGHGNIKVYDGSLLEWAQEPTRPMTRLT